MNETEQALKLSILYRKLVDDIYDLSPIVCVDDGVKQRAIQLVSDTVEGAFDLMLTEPIHD